MGEFVRHPRTGEEIKIGMCDKAFYSRDRLLELQAQGYKGFYAGHYDEAAGRRDSLKQMLDDPKTLYPIPAEMPFDPLRDTVVVGNHGFKHDKVIVHHKRNRAGVYVYTGLECAQKDRTTIFAVIIGERYDEDGHARTILKCDCCEAFFSLDAEEAQLLREVHPRLSKWIKHNRSVNPCSIKCPSC